VSRCAAEQAAGQAAIVGHSVWGTKPVQERDRLAPAPVAVQRAGVQQVLRLKSGQGAFTAGAT
jgi:hypothetical protein